MSYSFFIVLSIQRVPGGCFMKEQHHFMNNYVHFQTKNKCNSPPLPLPFKSSSLCYFIFIPEHRNIILEIFDTKLFHPEYVLERLFCLPFECIDFFHEVIRDVHLQYIREFFELAECCIPEHILLILLVS